MWIVDVIIKIVLVSVFLFLIMCLYSDFRNKKKFYDEYGTYFYDDEEE